MEHLAAQHPDNSHWVIAKTKNRTKRRGNIGFTSISWAKRKTLNECECRSLSTGCANKRFHRLSMSRKAMNAAWNLSRIYFLLNTLKHIHLNFIAAFRPKTKHKIQVLNAITPSISHSECVWIPVITYDMLISPGINIHVIKTRTPEESWCIINTRVTLEEPWVSLTWRGCMPSIIITRHPHRRVAILTSLFGRDCQLTTFEVTLNKRDGFTTPRLPFWCADISVSSFCPTALTHVVQGQQDLSVIMFPKNDSPRCSVMNLLSLWDEITCCVSSGGRVIHSDYQAMLRIFDYLQGMLITPLLDFSVTPAINPRHSPAWWNRRTLLNVINSHDRFWTSLHWVLWSREITPGYCEYLMDPRVSINVEKLFIALSFHVHQPRFLLKSTYPEPVLFEMNSLPRHYNNPACCCD